MDKYLIFSIQELEFALLLNYIDRVTWIVENKSVPDTNPYLLGLANIQGEIIPVINIRKILNLSDKALALEDRYVICRYNEAPFILLVDSLEGVIAAHEIKITDEISPLFNNDIIQGIIKENDRFIYVFKIEDLFNFLNHHKAIHSNEST